MKPALIAAAAALLCSSTMLPGAVAQTGSAAAFPAKPLRLVVAVVPGGNLDIIGRAVAQKLGEGLGRQVIVENRPGASAMIGTEFVARSAPDGYTYLMIAPGFLIAPMLARNPPFDPLRDFAGVSIVATLPQMLVVHPSVPVKTVREMIALAKSRPGDLNCGTSGNGSGSHLALERFKLQAGVRLTRIPFNGDAPAIIQLLGGQISLKFDNLSTSIPHVKAGKLRPLGVTSPQRSALLPQVPAIAETLPGFEASIFNGVVAPAGTPREVLSRVHGEIVKFAQSPDIRSRFARQGVEIKASASPDEFGAWLKSERARYAKLVHDAGITSD